MILPGGGWGNHPSERKGPFSANEIGNFIFTNTKLVDHSIPEEDWRPQTLSAYLRGAGLRLGPRKCLGYRPEGANKSIRTERDRYKKGWVSGGGKRKTRKRRGGNPDDKKKTYEQKLKDHEIELDDHNKTVADSYAPMAPRNRPSWASPTASGWAVAPYNRRQVFVAPEPPIDPSAGPAARPAAEDNDGPADGPAAGDDENYRTNPYDGRIRGPPLTQEEMEELRRNLREIREREEDEAYDERLRREWNWLGR